jgi:flagellar protein FliL
MADEQQQEQVEVAAAPPKKKRSLRLILLVGCLGMVIAAGAGYFLFGDKVMASYVHKKATVQTHAKHEVGPILPLEPFVFNLSGNFARLAKVSVAVELKDAKAVEETKKVLPVMRDMMLSVLGAKSTEVLMDMASRGRIKKELQDVVASLFKQGELKAVYITDIIMQ